jgi:hypothetical protein
MSLRDELLAEIKVTMPYSSNEYMREGFSGVQETLLAVLDRKFQALEDRIMYLEREQQDRNDGHGDECSCNYCSEGRVV